MQIFVVIATKNRYDFLKKSIDSVLKQSNKNFKIIVTSDSNRDVYNQEKIFCSKKNIKIIKNKRTNNYAGNLNTAIIEIIQNELCFDIKKINNSYIAFLDDDDLWEVEYLNECIKTIKNGDIDIIATGIKYFDGKNVIKKYVDNNLNLNTFLITNPNISGSNTFVKLSTLLMAGCFDENMSATTDRDLFVRLFMLNPTYKIINKSLVHINAELNRKRITTSIDIKKESLKKFYSKYETLMNNDTKNKFLERCNQFIKIDSLNDLLIKKVNKKNKTKNKDVKKCCKYSNLIIGFIASNKELSMRLLKQIKKMCSPNIKVCIFQNFLDNSNPFEEFENINILDLNIAKKYKDNPIISKYIEEFEPNKIITNIPVARTILQYFIYDHMDKNDVCWILDDDMEIEFDKKFVDIDNIIAKYKSSYDVVVGSYNFEPPVPLLSTLRTCLLDFTYNFYFNKQNNFDNLSNYFDYYYDLSDKCFIHLETPQQIDKWCDIDDIFNHNTITRKLNYWEYIKEFEVYTRGGNTLIFNREVLLIPNTTMKIGDFYARRGDFLWVLIAKSLNFKVIGSTFSTKHNRGKIEFNYKKEINKWISDLLGSTFIKSFDLNVLGNYQIFLKNFTINLYKRLSKFILNYYRIVGLLKVNKNDKYSHYFNFINLEYHINKIMQLLNNDIDAYLDSTIRKIKYFIKFFNNRNIQYEIEKSTNSNIRLLGYGNEGIVFTDDVWVYKKFYNDDSIKHLKSIHNQLLQTNNFEELSFIKLKNHEIARYKFNQFKKYEGGYAKKLVDLILRFKEANLVIDDFKKNNIVVTNDYIQYIDLGKSIQYFDVSKYEKFLQRAYMTFYYSHLNFFEFKKLIFDHYNHMKYMNVAFDEFKYLINKTQKEDEHDKLIIDEILKINPKTLLDYGCGKCKIANYLCEKMKIDVFDIDKETIKARASNKLTIIENIDLNNKKYDVINCNLVLCVVNNKTVEYILKNINRLTNKDSKIIISICNPYFDNVNHTSERTQGAGKIKYIDNKKYIKKTKFINRDEFHRSFEFYERILQLNNIKIEKIIYDTGVNADNLELISERMILVCKKTNKKILNDCSLVINTCSMEYETIHKDVIQIINQLEMNNFFRERLLVVDIENDKRLRKYNKNNRGELFNKINFLVKSKYIDRVVCVEEKDKSLYKKFFNLDSNNYYSHNKQSLLSILKGIDEANTKYIFRTDSDILFFADKNFNFNKQIKILNEIDKIGLSFIMSDSQCKEQLCFNKRFEIRNALINKDKLYDLLPLQNELIDGNIKFSFHKSFDISTKLNEFFFYNDKNIYFFHPENFLKIKYNIIPEIRYLQSVNKVNKKLLNNDYLFFNNLIKCRHKNIIFIRGKNVSFSRTLKLIESIKKQTYQDFKILYIDDSSNLENQLFLNHLFKYDTYLKNKAIYISNDHSVDGGKNFEHFYKNIVVNNNQIIINIDADDYLIDNNAILKIINEFKKGADVTIGGIFNLNKPTYEYTNISFKNVWERNFDNIWLHPKCFLRKLCNFISNEFTIDNKYIKNCFDIATMLPIITFAKKPVFIKDKIYCFIPSIDNKNRINTYSYTYKEKILTLLYSKYKNMQDKYILKLTYDSSNLFDFKYMINKIINKKHQIVLNSKYDLNLWTDNNFNRKQQSLIIKNFSNLLLPLSDDIVYESQINNVKIFNNNVSSFVEIPFWINNDLPELSYDDEIKLIMFTNNINKVIDYLNRINIQIQKRKEKMINYVEDKYSIKLNTELSLKELKKVIYRKIPNIIFDLDYLNISKNKIIGLGELVNFAKKNNIKTFLAHPFMKESGNLFSTAKVISLLEFAKNKGVDGIEIYHSSIMTDVNKINFLHHFANYYKMSKCTIERK